MRYEDWDVLLFPTGSRAPIKEFKVVCHVANDPEFSQAQGSFGLPTVCCFIPSQHAGAPFQVSVHSWETPIISHVTRAYSKHIEDVKFEVRLFIDGRLTASSFFERKTIWPYVIANSFHFSKNGDLEPLRFPMFPEKLLRESHWDPSDNTGRIKIIISEGFPRASTTMPFERVKNLVAFSFQHAPLDVLESSAIAWPNPIMWQRHAQASSIHLPTYSAIDLETHAHSPRRRLEAISNPSAFALPNSQLSTVTERQGIPQETYGRADQAFVPRSRQDRSTHEYMDWTADSDQLVGLPMGFQADNNALRKARLSKTDESMPDYVAKPEEELGNQEALVQSEDEGCLGHPKAPFNTPADGSNQGEHDDSNFSIFHPNMSIPMDLANSLTSSLLSQPPPCQLHSQMSPFPAPEIKSRKEARLQQNEHRPSLSNASVTSTPTFEQHHDLRKVSQQLYIPSGASLPTTIAPPQTMNHQPGKSRNTSETATRTASIGESGANMISLPGTDPILRIVSSNSVEQSRKTSRKFTPASPNVLDEEDEHHLSSARVRLTPFIEDADDSS